MRQDTTPALDGATLRHAAALLEARLQAVVTYGAGGCAACHDAELRGAISLLKRLAAPAAGGGIGGGGRR